MNRCYSKCARLFAFLSLGTLAGTLCFAQANLVSLKGRVTDPSALFIPDAIVTVTGNGVTLRQNTDNQGQYQFLNLKPGAYTVRIAKSGFAVFEVEGYNISGPTVLDAQMVVTLEAQQVTVREDQANLSVDPNSNAGALVIKGDQLDALSDDPDQLEQDLQALAGPSAGPNGGQIFIDGFSGGNLPPKSSIREIRVNQNPFSAEYDRLGFGRIEIFTKPGADKLRGQLMTMYSNNAFNARNPFVTDRPPYYQNMIMGSLSGPVTKTTSFSLDVERRATDESAVVNATVLDTNFNPTSFSQSYTTPQSRWHIVPRFDMQLNAKNTLTFRYGFNRNENQNEGVGNFSLDSLAYNSLAREHTFQATETAVLSSRAINETRFQYIRSNDSIAGDNTIPTISVLDAFTGGGAQVGNAYTHDNLYELSNMTSLNAGAHSWKFGGRLRVSNLTDNSPANFGGTFTFSGGSAPVLDPNNQIVYDASTGNPVLTTIDSIERYRRTQYFLAQGLTIAQVIALGGGASQFSIAGGNPLASVNQTDVGVFALDDWRIKPNLTLGYGVRYETQSNISDWRDISPRLSLSYGIGGGQNKQTKTVLRAGFGIFYDRIANTLTMQSLRFNGVNQRQYIVTNPGFYPTVPSLETLGAGLTPQTLRQMDQSLRAPSIMQTAIGIDRQLPANTSVSVTYTFSRGTHMLRTRNINAPLADGSLPYGDLGNIYLYETTGNMRQNQLITNVNTRFNRRFSLFGFYMLNYAKGDTDGLSTFPSNSYDLSSEWGSTSFDVRHRVFLGGSVTAPFKLTLNPFITASSGAPFNIFTGTDLNGDTVINDRPAFATATPGENTIATPWGVFNTKPGTGDTIIPRNYGRGPGRFTINMRLSRTWGFGERGESGAGATSAPPGAGGGRGPGGGGPGMMRGGGGGHRGGPGGMFGEASTGKRFNLTLSVSARNLLNNVNLAAPTGNLLSNYFGQSTSLAGGFGPGGNSSASNRRIDLQLRFSF